MVSPRRPCRRERPFCAASAEKLPRYIPSNCGATYSSSTTGRRVLAMGLASSSAAPRSTASRPRAAACAGAQERADHPWEPLLRCAPVSSTATQWAATALLCCP